MIKSLENVAWECPNCGAEGDDAATELAYNWQGSPRCPDCMSSEVRRCDTGDDFPDVLIQEIEDVDDDDDDDDDDDELYEPSQYENIEPEEDSESSSEEDPDDENFDEESYEQDEYSVR